MVRRLERLLKSASAWFMVAIIILANVDKFKANVDSLVAMIQGA